ncbi:MAG: DHH family phosphoesterase [Candidatus Hydrothermarchaeota archaeon]
MPDSVPKEMEEALQKASAILREELEKGRVARVITHNDADGITSGAIVHKALLREGHSVHTRCLEQLEEAHLPHLKGDGPEVFLFTDIGSGLLEGIGRHLLDGTEAIVLDHHQPRPFEPPGLHHINPHNYGIEGAREVSGSGMAYLFARALNPRNKDLAALGIVGAVGDLQDANGGLIGLNREIVRDGLEAGVLVVEKDLRLFGRQTRPLHKAIEYTTEPFIPGLSGSESSAVQFLNDLDIPVKRGEEYTMLADLSKDERQRLVTALILKMIEHKIPPKVAEMIVGEVYTLVREAERTPLRDAKEYATLLNGCGKHGQMGIGLAVCLGERGSIYHKALEMLREHKAYLSNCYAWISANIERVKDTGVLYHFHAKDEIDERVIGTVASMVLNSRLLSPLRPILAFSETKDGFIKVSGRGTRELVERGLNLGKVMQAVTQTIGGEGGGHDIAAGAKIQKGKEEEFLRLAEERLREQLHVQG